MSPAFQPREKIIRVVLCAYPGIFADAVIKTLRETETLELVGLVYSERIFSASENWISGVIRLLRTSGLNYALLQFMQTELYFLLRMLFRPIPAAKTMPIYRTKNINTPAGLDFLKKLNADIILLANFNQKVSNSVISSASVACLNIHPSQLPRFKGVDPVFAALYANEQILGVSVHYVNEDFDSGEIITQALIPTDKNRSVFYHQWQLFQLGAKLAVNAITHRQSFTQQIANDEGHYDSWPTRTQVKTFKKCGGHLITWADYIAAIKI